MKPAILTLLIVLYWIGYAAQYYIFNLFLTELSGNKFVNSVIFGGVMIISVCSFGILMEKMRDTTVFQLIFFSGMLSYFFFIFFPDLSHVIIYASNCLFVAHLGGWQNLGSLISELRVPPERLGSVNMIAQTIGVGSGLISPFIATLTGETPLMISAALSITVWAAMFALPKPGNYLTKVEELRPEKDSAEITDKNRSLIDSYREDRCSDATLKIKKTSTTTSLLSNDC